MHKIGMILCDLIEMHDGNVDLNCHRLVPIRFHTVGTPLKNAKCEHIRSHTYVYDFPLAHPNIMH